MYQIVLVSIYVMSAAPGERDAVFLRHIIGIEWPDLKKVSICYMHAHMYMCAWCHMTCTLTRRPGTLTSPITGCPMASALWLSVWGSRQALLLRWSYQVCFPIRHEWSPSMHVCVVVTLDRWDQEEGRGQAYHQGCVPAHTGEAKAGGHRGHCHQAQDLSVGDCLCMLLTVWDNTCIWIVACVAVYMYV